MNSSTNDSKRRIEQLKHLQAWETHAARLLGGWQPAIRLWEAKHAIGLHLWQDLQTARELRTRLWELRVSRPDNTAVTESVLPAIKILACAQHDFEFVAGIYLGVKKALAEAYRRLNAKFGIGVTSFGLSSLQLDELPRPAEILNAQPRETEALMERLEITRIASPVQRDHIDWNALDAIRNDTDEINKLFNWLTEGIRNKNPQPYSE